ncbi:MAG: OmpA family protein [Chromatiaceae bacterium]|nr:OmpA family protein [Chromatiaceae bacterium]MCP5315088.1 OmpA family protein [Chromatiaceae bacterium]
MKKKAFYWCLGPALVLAASTVEAGGVRMYGQGEIPQAGEVASILSGGTSAPKMRGISLDPVYNKDDKVEAGLAKVAAPKNDAIGVPVEFAFNSADISPDYKPQLDAIAEGIKMTNGVSVVVEGHTDAYGAEGYNEQLSLRRAAAVKEYLVSMHGIGPSQLIVKGYGEALPIDSTNPFAAANRRVQFRAAN